MRQVSKQLSFQDSSFIKPSDEFGGALLTSNPKTKRPLDSKLPLHVVLRAHKSLFRFPKTMLIVNELVYAIAKKNGIRIYRYANCGNHLHIAIKGTSPLKWARFIRALTGALALKLKKLFPLVHKIWRYRPYTRIVRGWKRAFTNLIQYIELNELESTHGISRAQSRLLVKLRSSLGLPKC